MKILAVSLDYPPTVGGISAHVFELYQAMRQLGHEVTILTKKHADCANPTQMVDGVRVLPLPPRFFGPTYGRAIDRAIDRAVQETQADIVHLHGMRPLEFLKPKPVPIIYTNHTSGFLTRLEKGGYRIPRMKSLFAPVDMFLAPSEELLALPFDIRADKKFISNGIVPERFIRNPSQRQLLRVELGLTETDRLAIVTRRLVDKNGVIHLARATQHIKDKNLKLLFIGDGPERAAIAETLERHFTGRFTMLGAMQHHEIVPYYSAADLSILPSLMEATSISCLEAMAAGLPIICSAVGGLPFLVQDGANGFLSQPAAPESLAACIDRLLTADMAAMGAASRQAAEEKFSWQAIARQTIAAYEQVL